MMAFGPYDTGKELYGKAASKDKDLYVIEGASHYGHYGHYDNSEATDKAVAKLTAFYRRVLA